MNTHIKTAIRRIAHSKVYSSINILGLTIGLAATMLVATVVLDDLSYDRQWSNSPNLYRIVTTRKMGSGLDDRFNVSLAGVPSRLKADYPEVRAVGSIFNREERMRINDREPNGVQVVILNADTSVWQLLDLTTIAGNPRSYVAGTGNIVLTEGFCRQYFPHVNPIGKTIYKLEAFANKPLPYLVTGIIRDLPANSVFRAQAMIIAKPYTEALSPGENGSFVMDNFVLVRPGTDTRTLETRFNQWYTGFVTVKNPFLISFQPLKYVYLHSDFAANQRVKGDERNIYVLSGIALLLLIVACLNYVNLTTARALQRLPETGVRKVMGAARSQLVRQFLTESLIVFTVSTVLATLTYILALPLIEHSIGHPLTLTFISRYSLFGVLWLAIVLISLLAGIYPAWVLSGYKPAVSLKGMLSFHRSGAQQLVRKGLVVVQFTISLVVLIALIVVKQQVAYMKGADLGFNKNNLLHIGFSFWERKGEAFKNKLLREPDIESASFTSWDPSTAGVFMTKDIDDPNQPGNRITVSYMDGDVDLAKTLGLGLVNGRWLDKSYGADEADLDSMMRMDSATYSQTESRQSSIITAYTARALGVRSLNRPIAGALTSPVGIVRDFNRESLRKPLTPTIIVAERSLDYASMVIRTMPGHEDQALAYITKTWREFFPDKLLEIDRVTDMLDAQYRTEAGLQELFTVFSSLSMFLAALGILGLIIHATEERRKEIGIRKVLGAPVNAILRLFSAGFLKLIVIALIIASPIAWWLMSAWLHDFAYRIRISPWVFLAAGVSTAAIALATISLQTVKAALANPVDSLRTE